ncbi:MAG TPA: hypothetical protein VF395_17230 [Polyangiaceae bacterium]
MKRSTRPSRLASLVLASALGLGLGLAPVACGGAMSVLHAKGKASGDGPVRVDVLNSSGVSIEKLYVAKAEAVDKARAGGAIPDSDADIALWGEDRLGNAGLLEGHTFDGLALPEGRWDVLVVDHDHREQLVKHLTIRAGRKYVLEIGTDWTQARL